MRLYHAIALAAAGLAMTGTACSDTAEPPTPSAALIVALTSTTGMGIAGEEAQPTPAVRVLDRAGGPVSGAPVTFQVVSGGGSLAGAAAISDAAGLARAGPWILGPDPGLNLVRATVPGSPAPPVDFIVTAYGECSAPCVLPHDLAFIRAGDVYLARSDGSGELRLTTTGDFAQPVWSPDGRRLAVVRDADGLEPLIYVLEVDGSRSLRPFVAGRAPAWSPDGRRIAFSGFLDGHTRILVRSYDDEAAPVLALGFDRGYNDWPAWSPDGRSIAFVSDWTAFDFALELYVAEVEGPGVVQLTDGFFRSQASWPSYTFYLHPAWSPDGESLAVAACDDSECQTSRIDVLTVGRPGSRLLATGPGLARPAWAPDGSLVAFSRTCWNHQCPSDVFAVAAEGSHWRLLVRGGHSPAWRP